MSLGWVKKWRRRLREGESDDEQVLYSRLRAPKQEVSELRTRQGKLTQSGEMHI